MMIPRQSIAFLLLASAPLMALADLYHGSGTVLAAAQKRRSVQGMDTTSAPSPARVGTSYCTDAPDNACYPSTNGRPACCGTTPDECPTDKQPCENATTPTTAPATTPGGGTPGDSYCTYAPDYDCYVEGYPMCCLENEGANCPAERPSCDDASDVPSMVPTPATSGGGLPSALPTPERAGTSYCTDSPDPECYPTTNGFPACCGDDPTTCPATKPACESSGPTPSGPTTTAPVVPPSPSPVAPTSPTAGTPTSRTSAAAGLAWSSILALAMAIVGVAMA